MVMTSVAMVVGVAVKKRLSMEKGILRNPVKNFLVVLRSTIKAAAVLAILLSLSACQFLPPVDINKSLSVEIPGSSKVQTGKGEEGEFMAEQSAQPASPSFVPLPSFKGSGIDQVSRVEEALPFSEMESVHVAVDEMKLPDFIHYVFGDVFRVNYIVDDKVKSQKELITLNLQQDITKRRLYG